MHAQLKALGYYSKRVAYHGCDLDLNVYNLLYVRLYRNIHWNIDIIHRDETRRVAMYVAAVYTTYPNTIFKVLYIVLLHDQLIQTGSQEI